MGMICRVLSATCGLPFYAQSRRLILARQFTPAEALARLASPVVASPIVDAADDHVARVEGQRVARRSQRRAWVAQNSNLLVGTDDFLRPRQLDPAIATAGAHHRVRFRNVIQQRRIDTVLAAVLVGYQG